ncbi:MAG TPA: hypothetical protein VGG60_05340 [Candidatus Binataceae bacterium]|jgi:hypothetical protein
MGIKKSEMSEDFGKLLEAAWFDLPAAAIKRLLSNDDEGAVRDAGWKAYDAWVRLANDASNRMYANPTFGSIAGRGIQTGLQVTRVVDAVASAVFGNLWPAIGLPTATDVQALRADVKALREELRTVRAETADEAIGDERQDSTFAPPHRGDSESAAAAIIWNGYKPAPKRAAKGSKKSVAL